MNDFLDAINNSKEEVEAEDDPENPSKERYDDLKEEEADVDTESPAEKRYSELKDEAKEELIENSRASEEEDEEDEEDQEGFITY